jgi:glycogen synthase
LRLVIGRLLMRPRMNILFCSVPFWPSVGGIETVSAILVDEFVRLGHSVVLITQTAAPVPALSSSGTNADIATEVAADVTAFSVVRQPSALQLLALVKQADVVFHNNISLRWAWPLLLVKRPWVVAHHIWIPHTGWAPQAWAGRVKRSVLRWASNVACSQALARSLPVPCTVVPNAYAQDLFRQMTDVRRDMDIVCLARLVSDKGVHLLLQALALLKARGLSPTTTIVGDGPQAQALKQQTQALGLANTVKFAGQRQGQGLVRLLNQHRVVVVPSVWEEPFGLVALEAQACGCLPVVARSGGLPEAAGPCALVFDKGSASSLADSLVRVLQAPLWQLSADEGAQRHLAAHRPARVAAAYLAVLTQAFDEHRSAAQVV